VTFTSSTRLLDRILRGRRHEAEGRRSASLLIRSHPVRSFWLRGPSCRWTESSRPSSSAPPLCQPENFISMVNRCPIEAVTRPKPVEHLPLHL